MVPGILDLKGFAKPWIFMIIIIFVLLHTLLGVKRNEIGNVELKKQGRVGRTEVSVWLDCIAVCALSSGHGPRNP